jgi:hypothetical protein
LGSISTDGSTVDFHDWDQESSPDNFFGDTFINYLLYKEGATAPIPTAGWLFMTALLGLVGKKRLAR